MDLTKKLFPLCLSLVLIGCGPTDEGSDTDTNTGTETGITESEELALAKSFVDDFANLQSSLSELEMVGEEFADQARTDIDSVSQADVQATSVTLEAVISQLGEALGGAVVEDDSGNATVDFSQVSVSGENFTDNLDLSVSFGSGSSYSISNAGLVTASGTASVGDGDSVAFSLEFDLPAFSTDDTGNLQYELLMSMDFSAGNFGVKATNAGGSLNLALPDGTTLDTMAPGEDIFESMQMGVDSLTVTLGGLTIEGATQLGLESINTSLNETDTSTSTNMTFGSTFVLNTSGKITTSTQEYLNSSFEIRGDSSFEQQDGVLTASQDWSFDFTAHFKTADHEVDVITQGAFSFNMSDSEASSSMTMSTDGSLTFSHNGALLKTNIDLDPQAIGSALPSLVLQDATVSDHSVIITIAEFDDPDTQSYEFGQLEVNGTLYATLLNDMGSMKADFTDGSSIVYFNTELL